MNIINILPFFVLCILAILTISLPFFKSLDELPLKEGSRVSTLDGLRGFLAFAVLVNHIDTNLNVIKNHAWSGLYLFNSMLGSVGVALFFMITGYLFWGKLLRSNGSTNWVSLYINRFFRIAPVYYLALFIVLALMAFNTDFKLVEPASKVMYATAKWMLLGFHRIPDVNGFFMMRVLGVVWTLRYEWIFYISLPFSAFFIRKKLALIYVITGLCISLIYVQLAHPLNASWALFYCGMLCASLHHKNIKVKINKHLASVIAFVSITLVFYFFDTNTIAGIIPVLLILIFFYLVENGNDLFGLLQIKGAHRLGNVSYSLYMLHMTVLYLFFSIPFFVTYGLKSELHFWILTPIPTILTLVIASLSYLFVEKPGIRTGKKFQKKIT